MAFLSHDTDPSSAPTLPFQVGEIIAGKYRVEKVVGVGGMAAVLSAKHIELEQFVAIKLLLPERARVPDAVRRFLTEARAAAKLKSDHSARISDVGTTATPGGLVVPYLVMELLEGQDLATLLAERGRLTVTEAVDFVLQACDAIAEAHAHGIVHRDIKPANLFLARTRDGAPTVKLLDFGISKTIGATTDLAPAKASSTQPTNRAARAITADNETMGSPGYMSPEQIQSTKDIDHRTDIWALGVVTHELLGGRDAFPGTTIEEILDKVTSAPPTPLPADVPPELAAVVFRCLEKDPARRFQSIGDLMHALAPFAPVVVKRPSLVDLAPRSATPTPRGQNAPTVVVRPRKTSWGGATIAGIVTLMAGLGALVAFAAHRLGQQPAASPIASVNVSAGASSAPVAIASSPNVETPPKPAPSSTDEPDLDLPDTSAALTPAARPSAKPHHRKKTKSSPASTTTQRHRTDW